MVSEHPLADMEKPIVSPLKVSRGKSYLLNLIPTVMRLYKISCMNPISYVAVSTALFFVEGTTNVKDN